MDLSINLTTISWIRNFGVKTTPRDNLLHYFFVCILYIKLPLYIYTIVYYSAIPNLHHSGVKLTKRALRVAASQLKISKHIYFF